MWARLIINYKSIATSNSMHLPPQDPISPTRSLKAPHTANNLPPRTLVIRYKLSSWQLSFDPNLQLFSSIVLGLSKIFVCFDFERKFEMTFLSVTHSILSLSPAPKKGIKRISRSSSWRSLIGFIDWLYYIHVETYFWAPCQHLLICFTDNYQPVSLFNHT